MTATKTRRVSELGQRLAALMRSQSLDARGLDRLCGVPSDSIRSILRGKTQRMTEANLRLISICLEKLTGRSNLFLWLRDGTR